MGHSVQPAVSSDPLTGLPNNTIHLQVEDSLGATSTDSTTVTIFDNRPFAIAMAMPDPVLLNQAVTFNASGSNHGHSVYSIVLYEWDFDGDGTYDFSSTETTATHSYPQSGTYTAVLRVTDDNTTAKIDTDTVVIHVIEENLSPVADAGGPYIAHQGSR